MDHDSSELARRLLRARAKIAELEAEKADLKKTVQAHEKHLDILNALDSRVYAVDFETHEILFANAKIREDLGFDPTGRICWQTLQKGQDGPCPFCNNHELLDSKGNPTGTKAWEFENTFLKRRFHIQDHIIPWSDGRMARLEIARDITSSHRTDQMARALTMLSNALLSSPDMQSYCRKVHGIFRRHMGARNFFVALADWDNDRVDFPYFSDEHDNADHIPYLKDPSKSSFTIEVIRTGKPLFITADEARRRIDDKTLGVVGRMPEVWLGVPLTIQDEIIGAVAVQDYEDPKTFTEEDVELMTSVSELIAVVLERSRMEAALLDSESRHRALAAATFEAVFISEDGVCMDCNQAACDMFGHSREELLGSFGTDIIAEESKEIVRRNMLGQCTEPYEAVARRKDGSTFPAEFRGRMFTYMGRPVRATAVRDMTEVKKNQNKIRRSLATVESIFRSAPVGMGVAVDRTITKVNDVLCTMLGYGTDELLEQSARILYLDRKEFERAGCEIYSQIDKLGKGTMETRFKARDGRILDVILSSSPIDPEDHSKGVTFTALDITERKKGEKALRVSEHKFRGFLEHLSHIALSLDTDGHITFANDNLLHLTGWSREEIMGRDWFDLFIPQDSREMVLNEFFKRTINGEVGLQSTYENEIMTTDGTRLMVTWTNVQNKGPDGKVAGVISLGVDVTRQRLAERRLEDFRLLMEAMADNLVDMLWAKDLDGRYLFANKALREDFLHSGQGKVLGMAHNDFAHRLKAQGREYTFGRKGLESEYKVLANKAPVRFVEQGVNDGLPQALEFLKSPLYDRQGELIGTVGVARDITEQLRTQEQLRRAKDAAERASRTKSEFLANMSHELRTPLHGIFGMLQLALETDLDREQKEYLDTALATGRSLLAIINDVLDFSKMEAGLFTMANESFNLRRAVDVVGDNFRIMTMDKGLSMSIHVGDDVPSWMKGDEARLRQVLFNLMGNSAKFTDQGSLSLDIINLGNAPGGEVRLLFTISDTGIGIPEERLDDVFEAFTQVDGAYTRQYKGTGLGLGIVRRLVELMGGNLTIASTPGQGTTVRFTALFGLAEQPAPRSGDSPVLQFSPRRRLRLLLAEDEMVNQIVVCRFLEKAGHRVTCAANGEEVLNFLAAESFDLLIMDIQMPVMDGLEATRIIRSGEKKSLPSDIPIIALTAHAMKDDQEKFLASGMNAYLAKPVDMAELEDLIGDLAKKIKRGPVN